MRAYFTHALVVMSVTLLLVTYAHAKHILVISSYHPENIWTAECIDGIQGVIGSKHTIGILYMDTKRKPTSEHKTIAADVIKTIKENTPDLIMAGDDNALKYLAPFFVTTPIPVVFYGINHNPREYFETKHLPDNVTGVIENRRLIPLGRLITRIVPATTNRLLILFDNSQSTVAHIENTLHGQQAISFERTIIEWKVLSYFDQWQEAVKHAAGTYDALIVSNHYTVKHKGTKRVLGEHELLSWIGTNSPVPAFGVMPHTVGPGKLIGAKVFTGIEHGGDAATMALQILDNNKKPSELSVQTTEPVKYYFNKANLNKFNLSLPPEIEHRAVFQ